VHGAAIPCGYAAFTICPGGSLRLRTVMIKRLRLAHARSRSVPRRFGRPRRYERRLRVDGHAMAV
jgi:hypothetical protein